MSVYDLFKKRRVPTFDANAFDAVVNDNLNVSTNTFAKPKPIKALAPKQDFDPVGYINAQGPADDEKSAF